MLPIIRCEGDIYFSKVYNTIIKKANNKCLFYYLINTNEEKQ